MSSKKAKNPLTMKAALADSYGSASVLKVARIDKPSPKKDALLVRIHNTTVNRTDEGILSGRYLIMRFLTGLFKPSRPTGGTDFAGQIEALGDQVKHFKVGDKVFGFYDEGLESHAEYMTISTKKAVIIIPPNISYPEAAASIEGAHYAYNMVLKAKIEKGQQVLVNGATGAIGSSAVQLLKYFGAEVTGVCRGKHNELVRSLGAKKTIDYEQADFRKLDKNYDLIIDTVVGSDYKGCKHLLMERGIYISSELGQRGAHLWQGILGLFTRGKRVIFPFPINIKRSLQFISELLQSGDFKALIDRSYPLDDIAEAYTYVASGQKVGNVLLYMDGPAESKEQEN